MRIGLGDGLLLSHYSVPYRKWRLSSARQVNGRRQFSQPRGPDCRHDLDPLFMHVHKRRHVEAQPREGSVGGLKLRLVNPSLQARGEDQCGEESSTIAGMEPTPPHAEAPLPRSISWFAPWRWFSHWTTWKRWTVLVVVVSVGYALSPLVSYPLIGRLLPSAQNTAETVVTLFYLPIVAACQVCPPVDTFYETGTDRIDEILTQCGWPQR